MNIFENEKCNRCKNRNGSAAICKQVCGPELDLQKRCKDTIALSRTRDVVIRGEQYTCPNCESVLGDSVSIHRFGYLFNCSVCNQKITRGLQFSK